MLEPNLKELAKQSIEEAHNNAEIEMILDKDRNMEEEHLKVKLFKVSYDYRATNIATNEGQQEIERQINEFLSKLKPFMVQNVDVKVVKNFLPHTQMGEYEEVWYGIVSYVE